MGLFSKIKKTFVGKCTKKKKKYVAGLDKSSTSFSKELFILGAFNFTKVVRPLKMRLASRELLTMLSTTSFAFSKEVAVIL